MRFLVIKTGQALPALAARRGDFEHWISDGLTAGRSAVEVRTAAVFDGAPLPPLDEIDAIVVTGSAAMVTARPEWSVRAGRYLVTAIEREVPTLAICYGHQLVADALGGVVGTNPRGREMGTIELALTDDGHADPLLGGFHPPRVQATHVESVLELPPGARHLAHSALDPHQAYAIGDRTWCVQFHPEFDADVMRTYVHARRDAIEREGTDADAMLETVDESPAGTELLARFAVLAGR